MGEERRMLFSSKDFSLFFGFLKFFDFSSEFCQEGNLRH